MFEIRPFSKFPTIFGAESDKFFDELSGVFSDLSTVKPRFAYPFNLYTKYDDKDVAIETVLEIALAGIKMEDVKISVVDDTLSVKITAPVEKPNSKIRYHVNGLAKRSATLTHTLLPGANKEKVSAKFNDGVLVITVPAVEAVKPETRMIEIQ